MLLSEQISQSLAALRGISSAVPQTVGWSVDGGPRVEADFLAVDSLSCAVRELRIAADELRTAPLSTLKAWAEQICQRVTYLLEHLGPLEADPASQTVLVRSTPPAKEPSRITFYEMHVQAPGVVSLRRYLREPANGPRQQVDLLVTHEVLQKLVRDVVGAIPELTAELPAS